MKKSHLILLLVLSVQLQDCKKDTNTPLTYYTILEGACGSITPMGNIGSDFNSALDSLTRIREPLLTGGCPGAPCYDYYVAVDTFQIDYPTDDRDFLGVEFRDIGNDQPIFAMSDVIDSYGNYYSIHWCND
jgi:hypothetical protein